MYSPPHVWVKIFIYQMYWRVLKTIKLFYSFYIPLYVLNYTIIIDIILDII